MPPSRRAALGGGGGGSSSGDGSGELRLAQRQVKGLMNRLNESNLVAILRDLHGVFERNGRGEIVSIVTQVSDLVFFLLWLRASKLYEESMVPTATCQSLTAQTDYLISLLSC